MSNSVILTLRPIVTNYCTEAVLLLVAPIVLNKGLLSSTIGCLVQFNTVGRRQRQSLFALSNYHQGDVTKKCMEATPLQKTRFWKRKGFLYTVGILFAVGIVVSALDDKGTSSSTTSAQPAVTQTEQTALSQKVSIGEEGYIKVPSPKTILANTKTDLDALTKIYLANDTQGIEEFLVGGQGFAVSNNTKVLVTDTAVGARRVRVLEGDQSGKSGWLPMEFVSKSK